MKTSVVVVWRGILFLTPGCCFYAFAHTFASVTRLMFHKSKCTMETVKINIKFRPSAVEGEKGMVYYQVTNGSTVKLICTGYLFDINEWNEARHILFGSKSGSALSVHLRDICERIRSETA